MGRRQASNGFTLIEISIVLVIIGLLVGGVLVGQDLIRSSEVRATITQIEKYQTAVNTFRGKYNALPGDMNAATAAQFGFTARGTGPGDGDGDGILMGHGAIAFTFGFLQGYGETVVLWVDLTSANGLNLGLIDGNFTTACAFFGCGAACVTPPSTCLPAAKYGHENYVYAYSNNNVNYFGLAQVSAIIPSPPANSGLASKPNIPVNTARNIDQKADDGFPQTGRVTAQSAKTLVSGMVAWVQGDGGPTDTSTATPPSSTTCYDDGGTTGAMRKYSTSVNNGANPGCALSFQFQ